MVGLWPYGGGEAPHPKASLPMELLGQPRQPIGVDDVWVPRLLMHRAFAEEAQVGLCMVTT